jgi:hypothetical protein
VTGGQAAAHEPLHFDLAPESLPNQYKVCPSASTRTVPLLVLIVLIPPDSATALA